MSHNNPSRIMITGTSGQVGQALAKLYATPDHRAVQIYPFAGSAALDLTDQQALRQAVRDVRPDVIINPAAYTAVDKAEAETDRARRINADAPAVLAAEAKRLGALFIHYSTDYVFPGTGDAPWRESDSTGPINAYGATKLEGEQRIRESGCDHLILRTQWVFSDYGTNFVKTMLRLGSDREALKVVGDQTGAPSSALFLARMTIHALNRVLSSGDRASFTGTYHLACSGTCTWYEFAQEIFAQVRLRGAPLKVNSVSPIPSSEFPTPAKRPHNSRLDCRLFKERFALPELQSWQSALNEVLDTLVEGS